MRASKNMHAWICVRISFLERNHASQRICKSSSCLLMTNCNDPHLYIYVVWIIVFFDKCMSIFMYRCMCLFVLKQSRTSISSILLSTLIFFLLLNLMHVFVRVGRIVHFHIFHSIEHSNVLSATQSNLYFRIYMYFRTYIQSFYARVLALAVAVTLHVMPHLFIHQYILYHTVIYTFLYVLTRGFNTWYTYACAYHNLLLFMNVSCNFSHAHGNICISIYTRSAADSHLHIAVTIRRGTYMNTRPSYLMFVNMYIYIYTYAYTYTHWIKGSQASAHRCSSPHTPIRTFIYTHAALLIHISTSP